MLKLAQERIDLGKIKINQPKTFTVPVINDGDEDVLVTRVQPGCGSCTTASMADPLVKAGGMQQLKVVFTPSNLGFNSKRVTLNATLVLFFSADVTT